LLMPASEGPGVILHDSGILLTANRERRQGVVVVVEAKGGGEVR